MGLKGVRLGGAEFRVKMLNSKREALDSMSPSWKLRNVTLFNRSVKP